MISEAQLRVWLAGDSNVTDRDFDRLGIEPTTGDVRFVVALLRDIHGADDAAAGAWMSRPRLELGGSSATEVIACGEIRSVELLLVRAWWMRSRRMAPRDNPVLDGGAERRRSVVA